LRKIKGGKKGSGEKGNVTTGEGNPDTEGGEKQHRVLLTGEHHEVKDGQEEGEEGRGTGVWKGKAERGEFRGTRGSLNWDKKSENTRSCKSHSRPKG